MTTKRRKRRVQPGWEPAFLQAYAQSCNVLASCRAASVARRTVYAKRASDPEFAAAMDDAGADAVDMLEATIWAKAKAGDTALARWLLAAHRPAIYGNRAAIALTGEGGGPVTIRVIEEEAPSDHLPRQAGEEPVQLVAPSRSRSARQTG